MPYTVPGSADTLHKIHITYRTIHKSHYHRISHYPREPDNTYHIVQPINQIESQNLPITMPQGGDMGSWREFEL